MDCREVECGKAFISPTEVIYINCKAKLYFKPHSFFDLWPVHNCLNFCTLFNLKH